MKVLSDAEVVEELNGLEYVYTFQNHRILYSASYTMK